MKRVKVCLRCSALVIQYKRLFQWVWSEYFIDENARKKISVGKYSCKSYIYLKVFYYRNKIWNRWNWKWYLCMNQTYISNLKRCRWYKYNKELILLDLLSWTRTTELGLLITFWYCPCYENKLNKWGGRERTGFWCLYFLFETSRISL